MYYVTIYLNEDKVLLIQNVENSIVENFDFEKVVIDNPSYIIFYYEGRVTRIIPWTSILQVYFDNL